MALAPRSRRSVFALLLAAAMVSAAPAHALRIVTWNLFQYPDYSLAGRQPNFRTVMSNIGADVLIAQELLSQAGRDSFLTNVLNVVEPGEWTATGFFSLQPTPIEGGAIFWKPAKVAVTFASLFATAGPRDVLFARVTPVGYVNLKGTFRIYSLHLKAGGPATADSSTRRLESTDIRNTLNAVPAGTNFLVGGDYNLYGAYEGAYIRLTESQSDNDGRCKDPVSMTGNWHVQPGYAAYYTQCPCATSCGSFSGGGMDDRFDLWLSSTNMQDGEGVDVVPAGAQIPYGNDGQHFNTDIDGGGFNDAVGVIIASALKASSDHLPVITTVQLAARVQAASRLDFGSVLIGATAQQSLGVANAAPVPADELDYSFGAPAGFTAPGGGFQAQAGVAANAHGIAMSTASVGSKSGTLTLTTDDPDSLAKSVLLTGKVLAHAVPSLDSAAIVTQDSLRFGTHPIGAFQDEGARLHNRGYGSLQARLSVTGATITGGDSRFSLVGGFSGALLAGTGQTVNVHFNDIGARPDSVYEATLTFATSDEPLPGAAAQPSLVLHLIARTGPSSTGVPGGTVPVALEFAAPRPNPMASATRFAFGLPRESAVTLEVLDLAGRRVAEVASGIYPAGTHELRWSAVDDSGARLAAGLYFARFRAAGRSFARRLIVLP